MRQFAKRNGLVVGMTALLLLQASLLVRRANGADESVPPGAPIDGRNLGAIEAVTAAGPAVPLADGEPRLLLVFHSECAHCLRVAPAWQAWLSRQDLGDRVLAVSKEPLASAREYAREHEWAVEVVQVDADIIGGLGHALTSRTPWIYLVDEEGVVVASGHGNRIEELGAMLSGAVPAVSDSDQD